DTDFRLGKVRPPQLEPTESTQFRFIVNQDEMSEGAKQRLFEHYAENRHIVLGLGQIRFTGKLTSIAEGVPDATFDENGPPQRTLRFTAFPEHFL
ncbi:MAG: hypothetical protein WCT03_03920, partial [Candidatus Obscuribacterales bacterium]